MPSEIEQLWAAVYAIEGRLQALEDGRGPMSDATLTATALAVVEHRIVPRTHEEIRDHLAAVLADVSNGTAERFKAEDMRRLQAELVFAYWQAKLGHTGSLLDAKRSARLVARLKENRGNVHELLFVVDGTLKDDHLMGRKGEGRKYDGIETLFRDRGQVERLAESGGYKPGRTHKMAEKYLGLE